MRFSFSKETSDGLNKAVRENAERMAWEFYDGEKFTGQPRFTRTVVNLLNYEAKEDMSNHFHGFVIGFINHLGYNWEVSLFRNGNIMILADGAPTWSMEINQL